MRFEENSIIYNKSFSFAIEIINLYKYLTTEKKEFIMSKQLLRCGTSIGANISESFNAQSKKDLISKLYISLKEAGECEYWLKLLVASNILDISSVASIQKSLIEIIKILSKIISNNKTIISNQ